MSMGANAAAIAAAAEAARLMREEEEEMTPYSDRDRAEGWEFKILRASTSAFRKPERLRAVLGVLPAGVQKAIRRVPGWGVTANIERSSLALVELW